MTPHRLVVSLALLLLACSSDAHAPADAGPRTDFDAGPDAGDRPQPLDCTAGPGLEIRESGKAWKPKSERSSGEWTAFAGLEVFRLRLEQSYDPIPEAVDDEFSYVIVIDFVPHELLGGSSFDVDQHIEVGSAPGDLADDPAVSVTSRAGHAYGIRRVLVEYGGFGINLNETDYDITGEISARHRAGANRVEGTLSLMLEGAVPHSFGGPTSLRIDGCFDVAAKPPADCQPGEQCGSDCLGSEEWPCWDCGALYQTHDCDCRPDLPPLSECEDPSPAALGERCGEFWWCDRQCADGLRCEPEPGSEDDLDGGAEAGLCTYYTCQR